MTALLLALALAQAQPNEATVVGPRNTKACEHRRTDEKFKVRFQNSDATSVFQVIADVTCFTFVVEKGIKAKISIHPDKNEPAQDMTANEIFNAAIAELEKQGVAVKEEATRRYRVSAVH